MSVDVIVDCKKELDDYLRPPVDRPAAAVSTAAGGHSVASTLDRLAAADIHLQQLKATGIGATVAKLRRQLCEDGRAVSPTLLHKADALVKQWKALARKEIQHSSDKAAGARRRSRTRSLCTSQLHVVSTGDGDADSDETTASRRSNNSARSADVAALISPDAFRSSGDSVCEDDVRKKSAQLIADALKTGDALEKLKSKGRDPASLEHLGDDLEMAVYYTHGKSSSCAKYKARVRQILFNLRHKENDKLRKDVLLGDISPQRLALMSSDELAPARVRTLRKSMEQETLHDHDLPSATPSGTEHSQMFKCHKCGERDTSYTLSQERHDNEFAPVPVTLVACNKCGNRWKSF